MKKETTQNQEQKTEQTKTDIDIKTKQNEKL